MTSEASMVDFTVLQRHWKDHLSRLFGEAENDVFVSSPYVTQQGADFLVDSISPSVRASGQFTLLTNLSPSNVTQGSTDPGALRTLATAAPAMKIYHLPRLHAKVYVADTRRVIVTSGNLTFGGLNANYEYGFCIEHARTVRVVRRDMTEYAGLGAPIDLGQLVTYSRVAEEVRATFREQQRAVARSARQSFEDAFRKASDELIKLRVSEGSLNTIFGRTILYLLDKEGPLSTQTLHPLIQEIHPDLCDDDVDRVIHGVRFGKKWKHAVRTAQQQLKRNGLIKLRDGRWVRSTWGVNQESAFRG